MKLKINGEYAEVGFWSFMKCNFVTMFALNLIIMLGLGIVFFIIGVTLA